jgi:relaxase-like protein
MAPRAILSVKYLAAPNAAAARRAVGGFVRYVQFRDHHNDIADRTSRFVGYVGHRDQAMRRGELFDRSGRAGDLERKALVAYVRRSLQDVQTSARPQRAVYRFVLSPADAHGLDLRELARATMRGLERDADPLPPWVAAVHRNTLHPHVHIVLAARREVSKDQFRTLLITKPRLARMKESLAFEMSRQLERSPDRKRSGRLDIRDLVRVEGENVANPLRLGPALRPKPNRRSERLHQLSSRLRSAARKYQRQMKQELEEERRRNREWGWER